MSNRRKGKPEGDTRRLRALVQSRMDGGTMSSKYGGSSERNQTNKTYWECGGKKCSAPRGCSGQKNKGWA